MEAPRFYTQDLHAISALRSCVASILQISRTNLVHNQSQAGVTIRYCLKYHPRSKTPPEKTGSRDLKQRLKRSACEPGDFAVIQLRETRDTQEALTSLGLSQNRGPLDSHFARLCWGESFLQAETEGGKTAALRSTIWMFLVLPSLGT